MSFPLPSFPLPEIGRSRWIEHCGRLGCPRHHKRHSQGAPSPRAKSVVRCGAGDLPDVSQSRLPGLHLQAGFAATTSAVIVSGGLMPASLVRWSSRRVRRRSLSTAAAGLALRLGPDWRGEKMLSAVLAAKVELRSIAFGVKRGIGIHGHSADRVLGHGCRGSHGLCPFRNVQFVVMAGFGGWVPR